MEYKNDKIKQLLAERNAIIEKYNFEIKNEIAKEKAEYKFNWKLFLLENLVCACTLTFVLVVID